MPHPSAQPPNRPEKPPYRVPLGLPKARENRRLGAVISLLFHLLLIYLLITPFTHHGPIHEIEQGAGGPGPAGGGGGGHGGTGGQTRKMTEHLNYVTVAPAEKPKPATVPPPPPKPAVVKPPPVLKPQITPEAISSVPTVPSPAMKPLDVAPTVGVGGGSGRDGTNGNGPGRGGGEGSGVGTGRGSGNGPGTGGGTQANYPPQPTEVFLPPYPIPGNVKGFHLVAEFDVDSTGRVLSMDFTPTPNGGYNRRLDAVFRSFKFRPGTTPGGTPVRMKAQIVVDLY
jgi:protein TonB